MLSTFSYKYGNATKFFFLAPHQYFGAVRWSGKTNQPAAPPLNLLFTKTAEQCFSLTIIQPEQCFSAKFQTNNEAFKYKQQPVTQGQTRLELLLTRRKINKYGVVQDYLADNCI